MFHKLRVRFILIAALTITTILVSMITVINSVRYFQTSNEIGVLLTIITENEKNRIESNDKESDISEEKIERSNYFSMVLDENNQLVSSNLERIPNLQQSQVENFAEYFSKTTRTEGIIKWGNFYYSYRITSLNLQQSLIVVLDTTTYFTDRDDLLRLSIHMSIYGFIFFIVVVSIFSKVVIRPFMENYNKQRRFITNAGHELKTPLAIISANNELQELMTGENEWTQSTKEQVERLNNLIGKLIRLARLEEQNEVELTMIDFSALVTKVSGNYSALLEKGGKTYERQIEDGLTVKASEDELYELISILLDNACKYCDENGTVQVRLSKSLLTRQARLEISNSYQAGKDIDYSRFFDRFYREDASRNSQTQGYGIGLSMAETLVKRFKGKISVSYKNGMITFAVVI